MAPPVIYYIRHGETDWNAAHRLQGRRDLPLNATGEGQALRCADILRRALMQSGRDPGELDYVSSPLLRARTSMELVRRALSLPADSYRVDPRLLEISFGEWEGLTYADLKSSAADQLALREQDPWNFAPPSGESYEQLLNRVSAWHHDLDRDVVVSAHLNTARALMVHLGLAPHGVVPRSGFEQDAVYVFDSRGMQRHDGGII